MAKRTQDPRLTALYQAGKQVYSISKINTIAHCLHEAYRTYILREPGEEGIYGLLGTAIHEKLEQIMNHQADPAELLPAMEKELAELDLFGITFPNSPREGVSIRDRWVADMTHFCKTFVPPVGDFETEQLFLYPLSENRYIHGYIDLIRHNEDGTISIFDWKTSSNFKKADLQHHGRQLILYALAKEAEGYKVRDVAWNMMKYCTVSVPGDDTFEKTVLNRGDLTRFLEGTLHQMLEQLGMDELQIHLLLEHAKKENSLSVLPEEIQRQIHVEPYLLSYDCTAERKAECLDYINRNADLFESLHPHDITAYPPRPFFVTRRNGKRIDDTFYCHVLCSHRNTCPHIQTHDRIKLFTSNDEDMDLF